MAGGRHSYITNRQNKREENVVTQSEKNCFFLFLLVEEMAVPEQNFKQSRKLYVQLKMCKIGHRS